MNKERLKLLRKWATIVFGTLALIFSASTIFYKEFLYINNVTTYIFVGIVAIMSLWLIRGVFLESSTEERQKVMLTMLLSAYLAWICYNMGMSNSFYSENNAPTVWLGLTYMIQLCVQIIGTIFCVYNIGFPLLYYIVLEVLHDSSKIDGSHMLLHTKTGIQSNLVMCSRFCSVLQEALKLGASLLAVWVGILLLGSIPISEAYLYILLYTLGLAVTVIAVVLLFGYTPYSIERRACRVSIGIDSIAMFILVLNHYCMANITDFGWWLIKSSPIFKSSGPDGYVLTMYNMYILAQVTVVLVYTLLKYTGLNDLGYGRFKITEQLYKTLNNVTKKV